MYAMTMPFHWIAAALSPWIHRRRFRDQLDKPADYFTGDGALFTRRQRLPGGPEENLRLDPITLDPAARRLQIVRSRFLLEPLQDRFPAVASKGRLRVAQQLILEQGIA